MIAHAIQTLYLIYPRYPGGGYQPHSLSTLDSNILIRAIFIESNYAILKREFEATFSYLLMCIVIILWDVMAPWLSRLLSTGESWVRLPLYPSRMDLGQVLYLQLPVRFGVKLRYSIRAVVWGAIEMAGMNE